MERVTGVSKLFLKRRRDGRIDLRLEKVTDDLLFAGTKEELDRFVELIYKRFKISKAIIDVQIDFHACMILQDMRGYYEFMYITI